MTIALGLLFDLGKCLRIHVVCVLDQLKSDICSCTFKPLPPVESMEERVTELNKVDE